MKLGELIRDYREQHSLSLRAFSRAANLSATYVSMIERDLNGRGKMPVPSVETYRAIAKAMGLDVSDLIRMVDDKIDLSPERKGVDLTLYTDNVIPMPPMHSVPLVGTIACGTPILAEQNIEGDVLIPEQINADFALRCRGDSMINARIFDGDIVYIRAQSVVDNGQIAAVIIVDQGDVEATLKRVHLFDDHIILEPANPMYPSMSYWGKEMSSIRILGKAVGFTSTIV